MRNKIFRKILKQSQQNKEVSNVKPDSKIKEL